MRLAGLTDLRRDPVPLINDLNSGPITILRRNRPVAILIHPDEIQRLADRIEDLEDALALAQDDGERIPHAEVVASLRDPLSA